MPFYPSVINNEEIEFETNNCDKQREEITNSVNNKNKTKVC